MEAKKNIIIAANPRSGFSSGADLVEQLQGILQKNGYPVQVITDLVFLEERLKILEEKSEIDCVIAAGGDGTVATVANLAHPNTPLCVLPLGTENLLARQMKWTKSPHQIASIVMGGKIIKMDAGLANGRLFLLVVSAGFDAEVVRRVHQTRHGHISKWSYAWPILSNVWTYSFPGMKVIVDGIEKSKMNSDAMDLDATELPEIVRWLFVMNLPRYAGGLTIAANAIGTDGYLNVCSFRNAGVFHGLRYLAWLWSRKPEYCGHFRNRLGRRIQIESDREVHYQIDGDYGGILPLKIEVLHERIRLLVP